MHVIAHIAIIIFPALSISAWECITFFARFVGLIYNVTKFKFRLTFNTF